MPKKRVSPILFFKKNKYTILILIGVAIDQATKIWAEKSLSMYKPLMIIPSIIEFQLVHNYGAAYGIFQNQRAFLLSVSIIVLIVCVVLRKHIATTWLSKYGLSFLLIGTLGNFIDRLRLSYVIDFINIQIFPVFNIADMAIDLGLVFFAIEIFVYKDKFNSKDDIQQSSTSKKDENEKNTTSS